MRVVTADEPCVRLPIVLYANFPNKYQQKNGPWLEYYIENPNLPFQLKIGTIKIRHPKERYYYMDPAKEISEVMKKLVFENEENKRILDDAGINVNVRNFEAKEKKVIEILMGIEDYGGREISFSQINKFKILTEFQFELENLAFEPFIIENTISINRIEEKNNKEKDNDQSSTMTSSAQQISSESMEIDNVDDSLRSRRVFISDFKYNYNNNLTDIEEKILEFMLDNHPDELINL